jgi:deoxyribodipyrimidine photo-lyase
MKKITIFWFRRDLRLEDNTGLFNALIEKGNVLPLFIFDKDILDKLPSKQDGRVSFIFENIQKLKSHLEEYGTSLLVKYGKPQEVFESLLSQFSVDAIYTNHDYEPYARERDDSVMKMLDKLGVAFKTFKDQVIFEKDEVTKDDGKPYTVFTPYMKKWRARLVDFPVEEFSTEKHFDRFYHTEPFADFELKQTGFEYIKTDFPSPIPDESIISNYDKTRDIPSINGTSRVSMHLRFGTVSIRKLVQLALRLNPTFLNELIWREFYMMILWHFPRVVNQAFKPKYDNIRWLNNEKQFDAWCKGLTGYPIVDAGMRQLNETGYMHNRVRMITASFLVKHLLIDWRWGETYFAEKLLDFELSSNNGGWQWAASSGCDATPYFRVFNPELQTKKFDPKLKYIKKWVPEFQDLSYPRPIVDHKFARERVLKTYKKALTE